MPGRFTLGAGDMTAPLPSRTVRLLLGSNLLFAITWILSAGLVLGLVGAAVILGLAWGVLAGSRVAWWLLVASQVLNLLMWLSFALRAHPNSSLVWLAGFLMFFAASLAILISPSVRKNLGGGTRGIASRHDSALP